MYIPDHWGILEQEAPFIVPSFLSHRWSPECQLMKNYCHFKELGGTVLRKPLLGAGLGFLNLNFQLTGGTLLIAAVLRLFWIAVRLWIVTHHSVESWAGAISTWLWQYKEHCARGSLTQWKMISKTCLIPTFWILELSNKSRFCCTWECDKATQHCSK